MQESFYKKLNKMEIKKRPAGLFLLDTRAAGAAPAEVENVYY
jgi:hypothetical protein